MVSVAGFYNAASADVVLPLFRGRADRQDEANKISFIKELKQLVPRQSCCGSPSPVILLVTSAMQDTSLQQPLQQAGTHTAPCSLSLHPSRHFHHLAAGLQFAAQKTQGCTPQHTKGRAKSLLLLYICSLQGPRWHLGNHPPSCREDKTATKLLSLWHGVGESFLHPSASPTTAASTSPALRGCLGPR